MQIFKYYKKSIIPSSLLVIIIQIVFESTNDKSYKSEWLDYSTVMIWFIIMIIINAIIVSILSLTILFNYKESVRNNFFISFISWFLSPGIYLGFLISKSFHISSNDKFFLLINSLPYLIGLTWGFIKFRRELNESL